MMLEEFHGVVTYDFAVISYLELMQQAYTGCNPRGLLLSKDKALSKKVLTYHRIPTPRFAVSGGTSGVRTQNSLSTFRQIRSGRCILRNLAGLDCP